MLSSRLRLLAQWRKPLNRWARGRLWQIYDQSYDSLLGHAPLHRRWLEEMGLSSELDSLLSIGPGRGELELALCRDYGCNFGYAESHSRYCQAVEASFKEAGLGERIIERHRGYYQNFVPQQRYKLILSIHSWYSFGYDASLMRRTLNALAPGGSFILTITGEDDFFFLNALKQQGFSAEEFSRWATEQGFPHKLHQLRMSVSGSELVADGALTDNAKGVISFLKGKLWRKIPQPERQQIEQRFVQTTQHGDVERVYGLLHFHNTDQP